MYNYYYRESHAEDEKEYLEWKMNVLGDDIITSRGIYKIKKGGWNVQDQYGFSTRTSNTFAEYNNMRIHDVILKLDYRGLIMFMLDDGWISGHSKNKHFVISGGNLSMENIEILCYQFKKYNINDVHIIGNKRLDLSIPKENNFKLYEMASSFIPTDIDIFKKKLYKIKDAI